MSSFANGLEKQDSLLDVGAAIRRKYLKKFLLASGSFGRGSKVEFLMEASFWQGVVASMVATGGIFILRAISTWRQFRYLSGAWVEVIETQPEFMYSIGRFRPSLLGGSYHYDGTNYYSLGERAGKIRYKWQSIKLHLQPAENKIYYIYQITNEAKANTHEGFGLTRLAVQQDGSWKPDSGYFVDAEDTTVTRKLKFYKASDIAKNLNHDLDIDDASNCERFIQRIISESNSLR